jgi:gamma-glutamylcyclotransferase (GGCT)/AIG2-like uncharacterized protein YtfP
MNVFVYGTLVYPEIHEALLEKKCEVVPGTLADHARFKVNEPGRDAKGPAIISSSGDKVEGVLLMNLNEQDISILDKFELAASGYERLVVNVTTKTGDIVETYTYVALEYMREFLFDDWTFEEFKEKYYSYYVDERVPFLKDKWSKE